MGWFDGNPAHLWEHPPVESAAAARGIHGRRRGGAAQGARNPTTAGDYRWVAQVVNYVIFADPDNDAAKALQASTFEQLGYGAENATWRNFYLSGAYELRYGTIRDTDQAGRADHARRADRRADLRRHGPAGRRAEGVGPARRDATGRSSTSIACTGWNCATACSIHYERPDGMKLHDPDAEFTLTRATLIRVLLGGDDFGVAAAAGDIGIEGDPVKLADLVHVLDAPDPDFAIVTP